MKVGVCVAIFQDKKILLTKRRDFEVWCLPGGHVDAGESVTEAAVREVAEETGLAVKLTRLVGLYSIPEAKAWVNLIILFTGQIVGGVLQAQEDEVLAIDYFHQQEIPQNLLWGHRQRILDAFNNSGAGVVWTQHVPFDTADDRRELYKLADESRLAGREFYAQHFGWADPDQDKQEIS